MSFRTGTYYCEACKEKFDELVTVEDYTANAPQPCPHCGSSDCPRILASPMVLCASYPDGTRRFQEFKEVGKLNVQYAGLDHDDVKEQTRIKKEAETILPGSSKNFKC
jgi:putative FmdB family regulatory protein